MGDKFNYLCCNGGELGLPVPFDHTGTVVPETSEPRLHPVPVTLAQICRFWWQVKDWILDTDLVFTDSHGNTFPLASGVIPNSNASVVRELNLISGSNYTVGDAHSFSVSGVGISTPLESATPVVSGVLYYPPLVISVAANNGVLGESVSLDSNLISKPFQINADLDGLAIPLYKTITAGGSVTVTKVKFTPNSFWPY